MAKANIAEKKGSEKKGSKSFLKKTGNGFKRFFVRIGRSFKDMIAELKKVTWASRTELLNYTMIVIAFIIIMGVVILAIDSGAGALVKLITGV